MNSRRLFMQRTGNAKSYTVLVVLKNPNRFTLPFTFNKIFPHSSFREYGNILLAGETRFEHATYGDQKIREKIAFFNEMHFLTCDKEL